MKTQEEIFSGVKLSGVGMCIFNILLLAFCIWSLSWLDGKSGLEGSAYNVLFACIVILLAISIFAWRGFVLLEPNESMVVLLFGKYSGTIKENGFLWVNPFLTKRKLTLRARNLDAEPIKVNDKTGNPIMIGVVVVWRVADTYKSSFHIDTAPVITGGAAFGQNASLRMKSYENFVKIQCDAALRNVAGMYSYDNSGCNSDDVITLRSRGEEINQILESQMNERLSIAGIEVIEARINYLAYAPEIAAVMLRRQQADAIIAAREKIVEGAVGMVKMALEKLSDEDIVDLDEERKAAMVSNLLVVLCGDESAQPVLNTGTLHN